jgi:hypothetical protein
MSQIVSAAGRRKLAVKNFRKDVTCGTADPSTEQDHSGGRKSEVTDNYFLPFNKTI